MSPFEATHGLSSPAIILTYSPDIAVDDGNVAHREGEQVIYITATDLISSVIIERLRMGKRSWVSLAKLERYAQEVKGWWERKGYSDVRVQISKSDIDDVLHRYSPFFERLQIRTESGEEKTYIAQKEYVSEEALRNRFCASLPIPHLTALSASWQKLI